MNEMSCKNSRSAPPAIAVIGMACHFPGSADLKTFWENVLACRRQFRPFPDGRLPMADYYDPDPEAPDKTYCGKAALIDGFRFDWSSHRIPRSSFHSSDIAHWLALDVALRSLNDAGFTPGTAPSERSGVVLGNTLTGEQSRAEGMRLRWPFVRRALTAAARERGLPANTLSDLLHTMESFYKSVFAPVTEDTLPGALSNTIAGRICNYLDWHGGGYTVDGACSSSLIAVATAASALTSGELDLALAGGVDISLDTLELIGFAKISALSKSDMRVYDRRADGFVPGEGCGFVVLKRLEEALSDGNQVYAVLRGWGISSDGKGGLTAPNAQGQATALRRAYKRARYRPRDLDFIEGHGTGTVVGDRTEVEGIALAMDGGNSIPARQCGITSLKSIIGHTKAASGIGGFIKAVIALNRRVLPPTANCVEPNPIFENAAPMLYPLRTGEIRCAGDTMRAGVSAMGFGGINCHVTLESAGHPSPRLVPSLDERKLLVSRQDTELFLFSASSREDLIARAEEAEDLARGISEGETVDLARHLTERASADVPLRAALIAGSPEEVVESIRYLKRMIAENPPAEGQRVSSPKQDILIGNSLRRCRVGFLFPGQGSQQLNMTRTIAERRDWARGLVEQADAWVPEKRGLPLSQHIFKFVDRAVNQEQIHQWSELLMQTDIAQPALCLSSMLWFRELELLGVRPHAAGGHSLGELTAFHCAGAFGEEVLLRLASLRGDLMASPEDHQGLMASLSCSYSAAIDVLKDADAGYAVIANINGPGQVIISGERPAVEEALHAAGKRGISSKVLPVSNAFHSRLMTAAAAELRRSSLVPETPGLLTTKLFSCTVRGQIEEGLNLRDHFAAHATSPVDFVSLVEAMSGECDMLLEVGPGRVLTSLARRILSDRPVLCLPLESGPGSARDLNTFLAHYFVSGGSVNWTRLYRDRLVRPFVPASQRRFIENPCERPFAVSDRYIHRPAVHDSGHLASILSGATRIPTTVLEDYISRRGRFLEAVIQADMADGRSSTQQNVRGDEKGQDSDPPLILPAQEIDDHSPGPDGPDRDSLSGIILDLIEKKTGFPRDSLSMDYRLLDDLNLDSIKAADFMAEAAEQLGVAGRLNVSSYANASLSEVADVLSRLNDEQKESSETMSAPAIQSGRPPWVRNFVVASLAEMPECGVLHEEGLSLEGENILILSEPEERDTIQAMKEAFVSRGASVRHELFEQVLVRGISDRFEHTIFITVLSRYPRQGAPSKSRMTRIIDRLRTLAALPRQSGRDSRKTTIAYVQFGGGFFGASRNVPDIEQCPAKAFAASIHLERPDLKVRVTDFDKEIDPSTLAEKVMIELKTPDAFSAAGYDRDLTRRVPRPVLHEPARCRPRPLSWGPGDVVLVTGGARGITAECALEFSRQTGARMALTGRTPHPGEGAETAGNNEIAATLKRFRDYGLTARYYSCDITEALAVKELVRTIEREMGPVTAVVHGSACNSARDAHKVSTEEAYREISPKVMGALNLCSALEKSPPRLFAGLTSLIGISGMMRNSWYGFSNEALNLLLGKFGEEHPETAVVTIAFSVWDEIGMGMRMGSTVHLARMGIEAIPPREGVRRFMQLILHDPGERQVVVAARLANLDTFQPSAAPSPSPGGFLEHIIYVFPEVEVIARTRLSVEKDPYVKDHVWRGTFLFPAVMGLEAMAQAAASLKGTGSADLLRIEDIRLDRPVIIHPVHGEEIEIRAEAAEREERSDELQVRACIFSRQTGFQHEHFSATFVFSEKRPPVREQIELPEVPLDIDPEQDLYNGMYLFQGPLFQRIRTIHALDSARCVFRSSCNSAGNDTRMAERTAAGNRWVAGDPFFRDSLLHAAQLPVLPDICLPLGISRIERFPLSEDLSEPLTGNAVIEERGQQDIRAAVTAVTDNGQVVERISGYVARIMERRPEYPAPEDIVHPGQRDELIIGNALREYAGHLRLKAPAVSLVHLTGLHQMSREQRRQKELPVMEKTARLAEDRHGHSESGVRISWLPSGRPVVNAGGPGHTGISLSHDGTALLCVAGTGPQGCDLAQVTERTAHEWHAVLGPSRTHVLGRLLESGEPLNRAGTCLWAAGEALFKATGRHDYSLNLRTQWRDALVFESDSAGDVMTVLTFSVTLTRGTERVVAVVLHPAEQTGGPLPGGKDAGNSAGTMHTLGEWRTEAAGGGRGQSSFMSQFPVTFKEASNPSRTLYFSHFFQWIGRLREYMVQPIMKDLVADFSTGRWGMVTNHAETIVTGEAEPGDTIQGRIWLDRVRGPENSTLEFRFLWHRLSPAGQRELIASSTMSATWVEITGHGAVEVRPLPEFGRAFVKTLLPPADMAPSGSQEGSPLPDRGRLLFKKAPGPLTPALLMKEEIFTTSLEDANLVGNIYFSNYYVWQGRTRDLFLWEKAPDYLSGSGKKGEFRCLRCRVNHMNEAMPFERIAVRMYVTALYDRAVSFCFEYYRISPDGQHRKLGSGEHDALWYSPAASGRWVPSEIPEEVRAVLMPYQKRTAALSPGTSGGGWNRSCDAVVIGAGIGGLTAAALLAKQGMQVVLVEQHNRPGGFCTSWERRVRRSGQDLRYVFDAGVHDISGLGPQGFVRKVLADLGVADRIEWLRLDHEYHLPDCHIRVPRDPAEYVRLLSGRFPAERDGIRAFFEEMASCYREMYAGSPDIRLSRWKNVPFGKMMDTFVSDRRLKELLSLLSFYISDDPGKVSALTMIPLYGYYFDGGHYPRGGSQILTDTLTEAFRNCGGDMMLGSPVSRILTAGKEVTGVELASGGVIHSDTVISNADASRTYLELVGPDRLPRHFSRRIEMLQPSCSAFMVSLGVDMIPDIGPVTLLTGGAVTTGVMVPSIADPSLAPEGHSCISLIRLVPHDSGSLWNRKDRRYRERKQRLGDTLIALAEKVIPGLKNHIVIRQDASPATFSRYTLTKGGAVYGLAIDEWRPSAKAPLEGLYLAGAGTAPRPGVESAVYSGIAATKAITERAGKTPAGPMAYDAPR